MPWVFIISEFKSHSWLYPILQPEVARTEIGEYDAGAVSRIQFSPKLVIIPMDISKSNTD